MKKNVTLIYGTEDFVKKNLSAIGRINDFIIKMLLQLVELTILYCQLLLVID